MYRIIKMDGVELGITDSVHYIKFGASGDLTTAKAEDAIGVAFKSVPYNLYGHSEIADAETVIVSAIDGGAQITGLFAKHIETEQMLTELDIANIEAQQLITDLELMILEGQK